MAWLVCVKRDDREPFQYIDDLVEVVDDNVGLPSHYPTTFNVLQVNGTRADVEAILESIRPQVYTVVDDLDTGKWGFDPANPGDQEKQVWRPANTSVKKWYNLVNEFKFPINIGNLTPEEKQLLQTYDIAHPSIASFINKVSKDVSSDSANNVEETDLKNQLPPNLS
jgi:hypothetical protein